MRTIFPERLELGRYRTGRYATKPGEPFGAFQLYGPCSQLLVIIASDGVDPVAEGWEHVSVSLRRRCPNWIEMSFVKDLFWEDSECVAQFHPPRSEYVNNHPNCLHLWKNRNWRFALPPTLLVGDKALGTLA